MPDYALHPQSLLMETTWVCSWFERLLKKATDLRKKSQKDGINDTKEDYFSNSVFIADRSPFSAVFYGRNGHLLEPVVREHMREAERDAGIVIRTLHIKVGCFAVIEPNFDYCELTHLLLQVERELLWSRIQQRLQREPHRYRYNEVSRICLEELMLSFVTTVINLTLMLQNDRTWMETALSFYENFSWDVVRVANLCCVTRQTYTSAIDTGNRKQ